MVIWNLIQQQQKAVCDKFGIPWMPAEMDSLVAFNDSLFSLTMPINGLRHPKHGNLDGWYLWSGDDITQADDNFFKPLHVKHLIDRQPLVLKYLGLPAGWKFQIDNKGYEDVWFDQSVLKID